MSKKQLITRIGLFIAIATLVTWPILVSVSRSRELRVLWTKLQDALENADQALIHRILADSDSDLHDIDGARVIYGGMDYTDKIINMKVTRTRKHSSTRPLSYEYYTNPSCKKRGKIVFREGYALTEDGKITFMKFH